METLFDLPDDRDQARRLMREAVTKAHEIGARARKRRKAHVVPMSDRMRVLEAENAELRRRLGEAS